MRLYDKSMILFPEYHLTDYPPQVTLTQSEAEHVLSVINVQKSDIIISGYVEKYYDKLFSSCLIVDGSRVHNIRKKYPYMSEEMVISSGCRDFNVIQLSIGASYFFICNDITVELRSKDFYDFAKKAGLKIFSLFLQWERTTISGQRHY